VGAHKGEEIESYLAAGIQKAAFIEPLHDNFIVLENRVKSHDGYEAYKFAAGDVNEPATLYLASNELQSSSILKPSLHLKENPEIYFNAEEEVEKVRIDNLVLSASLNFWVIDVQGYEIQVLKGAGNKIQECDYIFVELNRAEVYENCTKIEELDHYLKQQGFNRVLFRWWSLWGDGFYVKKEKLPMVL
jgi:FkbM family methyltransferase